MTQAPISGVNGTRHRHAPPAPYCPVTCLDLLAIFLDVGLRSHFHDVQAGGSTRVNKGTMTWQEVRALENNLLRSDQCVSGLIGA